MCVGLRLVTGQFGCHPNSPKTIKVPIKMTHFLPVPLSLHLTLPFLSFPSCHTLSLSGRASQTLARVFPGPSWPLILPPPTSHHEGPYNRRTVWVKASSLLAPSDPPGVTSRRHVLTEVIGGLGWDYCLVFRAGGLPLV